MGRRRNRCKLSTAATLAIALFSATPHTDELALEIVQLKHTLANDVLPLVQPLIAPGGTLTSMHDRLVNKTTPANLIEIKNVLAAFDRAPKTLRITVKQDHSQNARIQEDVVSGRFSAGNVSGRLAGPWLPRRR